MHAVNGMFLIRKSESKVGCFSLSVFYKTKIFHYRIYYDDGLYYIGREYTFVSLNNLVKYYSMTETWLKQKHLKMQLTTPCPPDDKLIQAIEKAGVLDYRKVNSDHHHMDVLHGTWKSKSVSVSVLKKDAVINHQSFQQLGNVLKKLSHIYLVQTHELYTEYRLIITEYVSQINLLDYVRGPGKSLEVSQLLAMAAQVSSGMAYLQDDEYVHGDLAAINVMIGSNRVCKIKNFGLSRLIYCNIETDSDEIRNFRVKWMAPEAAQHRQFSVKSDVWSFGVLLYELMTYGHVPYPGMSNNEVIDRIKMGYRMSCHQNTPSWLYRLMLDTWENSPHKRPSFKFIRSRLFSRKMLVL